MTTMSNSIEYSEWTILLNAMVCAVDESGLEVHDVKVRESKVIMCARHDWEWDSSKKNSLE